jgi:hypothetical protein
MPLQKVRITLESMFGVEAKGGSNLAVYESMVTAMGRPSISCVTWIRSTRRFDHRKDKAPPISARASKAKLQHK